MEKLNFSFTVDEINIIMSALASQPYGQVAKLIDNIRIQAEPQVNPSQEKPE